MSTATALGAGAAADSAAPTGRRCPLCQTTSEAAFTVRDRNRAISDMPFQYRRCRTCGTIFLGEPPEDLGRYYPQDYYVLPTEPALERAAAGEAQRLRMLEAWAAGGRLIEVGAGFGVFARAAKNAGYDVTAIEMDARCCRYLQEVVGVRAIRSDAPAQVLTGLPSARAIVLWHVLEHLPHPWETLSAAAATLEAGGVLALAMPNPDSLQLRALGPYRRTAAPLPDSLASSARACRVARARARAVHDERRRRQALELVRMGVCAQARSGRASVDSADARGRSFARAHPGADRATRLQRGDVHGGVRQAVSRTR
jgi:2-polyprenyl-3-methyl-5-hydroxy-6-metoxy-1,4-benzoquinol methylase